MAKPWLERWVADSRVDAPDCDETYVTDGYESDDRRQLISAAPDMCRALLDVEWSAKPQLAMCWCACCVGEVPNHDATCALDAALTKAGLPDQASRDAARKELGL